MKTNIVIVLGLGILSYIGLYIYFYSIQDDRFKSTKLAQDYKFQFAEKFEELNFKTKDGERLIHFFQGR